MTIYIVLAQFRSKTIVVGAFRTKEEAQRCRESHAEIKSVVSCYINEAILES